MHLRNAPICTYGCTHGTHRINSYALRNEKYKGEALLQKVFTVDFLTKKVKKNEGEVPQYYVKNSHPGIIDPAEWQLVQDEMKRRKEKAGYHHGLSPFAGKIYCGCCGGAYGPKVWHSTDAYRRTVWQCNRKYLPRPTAHPTEEEAHSSDGEKKRHCATPHLTEAISHFITLYEDYSIPFSYESQGRRECQTLFL